MQRAEWIKQERQRNYENAKRTDLMAVIGFEIKAESERRRVKTKHERSINGLSK